MDDRMDSHSSQFQQILECLNRVVLLLAQDGALLYANSAGLKLLAADAGWQTHDGNMSLFNASLDRLLHQACYRACLLESSAEFLWEVGNGAGRLFKYKIEVLPCRLREAGLAALLLVTPHREGLAPPEEILMHTFSLSPAELKVALAIAGGKTPAAYAAETGHSLATIRTQLRSIFRKTGCSRQTELVRFVGSLESRAPRLRR